MPQSSVRHNFSLLELTVAIAIMILVSGVVITGFRRLPGRASLQNSASQLKEFFTAAQLRALSSGTPQQLSYTATDKLFRLLPLPEAPPGKVSPRRHATQCRIADAVEIEFIATDKVEQRVTAAPPLFVCYPDGMIYGPDIRLKLRKHQIKLHISPLTGTISIVSPEKP